MNRIQTLLGSTLVAGALVATPVVLGLSAGQSGAAPTKATTAKTIVDDHGGKGRHREPGDDHGRHGGATRTATTKSATTVADDKGGKAKHQEPGDDHGRRGGGHDAGDDHGGHGTDG